MGTIKYSESQRTAAYRVCLKNLPGTATHGALQGFQLALVDYSANASPVLADLTWMPGIGSIVASTTNICTSTIIDSASGIASIEVLANTQ